MAAAAVIDGQPQTTVAQPVSNPQGKLNFHDVLLIPPNPGKYKAQEILWRVAAVGQAVIFTLGACAGAALLSLYAPTVVPTFTLLVAIGTFISSATLRTFKTYAENNLLRNKEEVFVQATLDDWDEDVFDEVNKGIPEWKTVIVPELKKELARSGSQDINGQIERLHGAFAHLLSQSSDAISLQDQLVQKAEEKAHAIDELTQIENRIREASNPANLLFQNPRLLIEAVTQRKKIKDLEKERREGVDRCADQRLKAAVTLYLITHPLKFDAAKISLTAQKILQEPTLFQPPEVPYKAPYAQRYFKRLPDFTHLTREEICARSIPELADTIDRAIQAHHAAAAAAQPPKGPVV